MGYDVAARTTIDVSNSNTPGVIDPTDPVRSAYYRVVAEVEQERPVPLHADQRLQRQQRPGRDPERHRRQRRRLHGRATPATAAIRSRTASSSARGAQILTAQRAGAAQTPGQPTPVGSFNVTQLGDKIDKIGKDTNFRGLTISDNVVYFTKGSGSNGVNTVYFIDTTGKACPSGSGLPQPGATLPTSPIAYDPRRCRPRA